MSLRGVWEFRESYHNSFISNAEQSSSEKKVHSDDATNEVNFGHGTTDDAESGALAVSSNTMHRDLKVCCGVLMCANFNSANLSSAHIAASLVGLYNMRKLHRTLILSTRQMIAIGGVIVRWYEIYFSNCTTNVFA
jgi:hypothetical protein